ncbi:hypothetical protein R3P38DRAFT_2478012, partial [Favolaschia claudopus]
SFKPYSLNSPGTSTQAAFVSAQNTALPDILTLDPDQWTDIAREAKLIPEQAQVRSFQVQVCNAILMRKGDCVVISATGSGKSLTWTLPLAARKQG